MKDEFACDQYVTKIEMAARLGVTCRTIDNWMSKGLVPYRKIGRTVRFDWAEVRSHLAQKTARPQAVLSTQTRGTGIADSLRERAREIRRDEKQSQGR